MTISTITPPTKDAWIEEGDPTENYGWYAFFIVKSYWISPFGVNRRTLIEFDISEITEGAIISSAILRVRILNADATGRTYQYRRITSSWSELGVTWNNQPDITETNGKDYPSPTPIPSWKVYSLTDMVQDARDEGTTFGVRIKDASESSKVGAFESRYYSKDNGSPPELIVTWELVTPPIVKSVGDSLTFWSSL